MMLGNANRCAAAVGADPLLHHRAGGAPTRPPLTRACGAEGVNFAFSIADHAHRSTRCCFTRGDSGRNSLISSTRAGDRFTAAASYWQAMVMLIGAAALWCAAARAGLRWRFTRARSSPAGFVNVSDVVSFGGPLSTLAVWESSPGDCVAGRRVQELAAADSSRRRRRQRLACWHGAAPTHYENAESL
jgi:hypothetical protein